jgi:ubiquitin-conjugating enzyme E2 M
MAQFEKDFRRLCRQIDSLSDGQARASLDNIFNRPTTLLSRASISSDSSSSSDSEESTSSLAFHIEITPRDGPYAHGSFVFRVETASESEYPDCQPVVSCLTPIYHPNIDTTYRNRHNNVCVSTLNDWDGGVNSTFEDLLQGLMFLFHSPNVDDPLTSNVSTDEEEFLKNVRIAIEGGSIEDFDENDIFEMNYGYKRYLMEKEKQQLEEEEKQQIEEGEKIDDHLISILTRKTNFREIFTADTLEFLMNNPSASSLTHSTRHSKETSANS